MLDIETINKLKLEQKKLDEFIIHKKNITDIRSEEGYIRSKIALLVEIGEFANELETFKHWKKQKSVNWKKAQEELIDCLHFYLSFVNKLHIDFSDYINLKNYLNSWDKIVPYDLSSSTINRYNELILNLFKETQSMVIWYTPEKESFYRWLLIFEELAKRLGINNKEDIYKAYMSKNKINWERQKNSY